MNLKKKKKGFTLIELMAVIAIIAILAAVLVPTVSGYINRSKKTAIITQARNAVNAVEAYNATAISENVILDGVGIYTLVTSKEAEDKDDGTTLANTSTPVLSTAELLYIEDLDRLPDDITVGQLKAMNDDKDALNNITVDKTTGKLESYTDPNGDGSYTAK